MKWCPSCKQAVQTTETKVSSTMELIRCGKCQRTLGQSSLGVVLWFRG